MELLLLNDSYEIVKIADVYQSLVWHEKIFDLGEFQFQLNEVVEDAVYLYKNDTNDLGIIRKIEIDNDSVTYSGELCLSMLKDRVITNTTTYIDKSVEYILKDIVSTYIPYVSVATDLDRGDVITYQTEIGRNIADIILDLNEASSVFGKLEYNYLTNVFTFDVVEIIEANAFPLSLNFETINTYKYEYDDSNFKNYAFIKGADANAVLDLSSGGYQKWLYVDASNVKQSYDDDGTPVTLSATEYENALLAKGLEALSTFIVTENIDINTSSVYNIGEITEFKDASKGISSSQLVTERMFGYEANSVKTYLTFGRPKITILKRVRKEFNL